MPKYRMEAREPDGSFAFGATMECADDEQALAKFNALFLDGCSAELRSGSRLVGSRPAEREASPEVRRPRRPAVRRG